MSVEIREIIEAARQREEAELAELKQWIDGNRREPLTPELKARWLGIVAEQGGTLAAAQTMDQLATQPMPEVVQ
ncbi:hypothetical protein [Ruegeria arenilitoris]|uniref:hypothetical protein n=1 Tax=Ruegeria arenilitoris TaxID=1173585 RepID=UPI00147A3D61|nr:hypothetical protein [Ruegeria arenilitoris]